MAGSLHKLYVSVCQYDPSEFVKKLIIAEVSGYHFPEPPPVVQVPRIAARAGGSNKPSLPAHVLVCRELVVVVAEFTLILSPGEFLPTFSNDSPPLCPNGRQIHCKARGEDPSVSN